MFPWLTNSSKFSSKNSSRVPNIQDKELLFIRRSIKINIIIYSLALPLCVPQLSTLQIQQVQNYLWLHHLHFLVDFRKQ